MTRARKNIAGGGQDMKDQSNGGITLSKHETDNKKTEKKTALTGRNQKESYVKKCITPQNKIESNPQNKTAVIKQQLLRGIKQ